MKAGIANSLSARCAGACPFARKEVGGGNDEWQEREEVCVVSPKNGEEEEKRRGVSQESPQVFIRSLPVLKKRNLFLAKDSIIRN